MMPEADIFSGSMSANDTGVGRLVFFMPCMAMLCKFSVRLVLDSSRPMPWPRSHELDVVRIAYRVEDEASVYGLEQGEVSRGRSRGFHDVLLFHFLLVDVYFFTDEPFLFP